MLREWKGYGFMADGLIRIPSSFGLKQTIDRLETEVMAKGLTIFARIDHAARAAQVGLRLRATKLLIFGNAKAGTPLMESNQGFATENASLGGLPRKNLAFLQRPALARKTPWTRARH
jgi:uncharacterized protein (DUF302 family)